MELPALIGELLQECRQQYGKNSLVLLLKNVQIHEMTADGTKKQQLYITSESGKVQRWVSKPHINIDVLAEKMLELKDHLEFLVAAAEKFRILGRKLENQAKFQELLLRISFVNHEAVISDMEILHIIHKALVLLHGAEGSLEITRIKEIVFPIAIYRHLDIFCIRTANGTDDIELYDFDGYKCGWMRGIAICEGKMRTLADGVAKHESPQCTSGGNCQKQLENHQNNSIKKETSSCQLLNSVAEKNSFHLEESTKTSEDSSVLRGRIREIVQKQLPHLSSDDETFTSLGADSFQLASIEYALQDNFKIPYGTVFQSNSVRKLWEYLSRKEVGETKRGNHLEEIEDDLRQIILNNGTIPLSAAQKRCIFLYEFYGFSSLRFMEKIQVASRNLDIRRFSVTFNRLVARQLALRMQYTKISQTVLSLTEAYFWIRLESESVQNQNILKIDALEKVPLRLRILVDKDDLYSISIWLHHVMIDGFSMKIFANELWLLYEGSPLEKLSCSCVHYALLEEKRRSDIKYIRHREAYWKQRFQNLDIDKMITDNIRSSEQSYEYGTIHREFSGRTLKKLGQLREMCNVTDFSTFLALYHMLLYKSYSIQDYCTGIAVADRNHRELQTVIGCLLNVVPCRIQLDADKTVLTFVKETANTLNDSIRYQLPFDDLINTLRLKRDTRLPLFQVVIVMDEFDFDDNNDIYSSGTNDVPSFRNNDVFTVKRSNQTDSNFVQYDQVWFFIKQQNSYSLRIEYNATLYYEWTVTEALMQFLRLIDVATESINKKIADISLITDEECLRQYRLKIFNTSDYPKNCTINTIMKLQNEKDPDCNLVRWRGTTYKSADTESMRRQVAQKFSQLFQQYCGLTIRPDQLVIVRQHRSLEFLVTVLALWDLGCAPVPIDISWPEERSAEAIKRLKYPPVITASDLYRISVPDSCLYLQEEELFDSHYDEKLCKMRNKSSEHDLAYMTFTSGSTGFPKGICTELYGLNNLLMNYTRLLGLSRTSEVYQVVNPSFDIFFADILEAFTNGATLTLASGKIPDWKEMRSATHAHIMPAYLSAAYQDNWQAMKKLKAIHFGGDTIQPTILKDGVKNGIMFNQQYGLTEQTVYSSFKRMKVNETVPHVGRPFENIYFTIRDFDKHRVRMRQRGICCPSGIGICRGYFGNDDLNQKVFPNDPNLTKEEMVLAYDKRYCWSGDVCDQCNDNGEIRYHGRNDRQVKIRGHRVELTEIEAQISTIPFVKSSVVMFHRLQRRQMLVAYVILDDQNNVTDVNQVKQILSHRLPDYMVPTQIVMMESFPLNSNGKVDRALLPVPEQEVAPRNLNTFRELSSKERIVLKIFEKIIPATNLQLSDSFFDVGGDSLKALLAIQQIRSEVGVSLRLEDIFRQPTIDSILQNIDKPLKDSSSARFASKIGCSLAESEVCDVESESQANCKTATTRESTQSSIQDSGNKFPLCEPSANKKLLRQDSSPEKSPLTFFKTEKFWLQEGGIPLSYGQERLLFLHLLQEGNSDSYLIQFKIVMRGSVDSTTMHYTINYLIRYHNIFRTVYHAFRGNGVQEVLSLTESYIDVRHRGELLENFGKVYFNLEEKPPLLAVCQETTEKLVLYLTIHHIMIDGYSFAILAKDVVDTYKAIANGVTRPQKLNTDDTYANYSLQQRSQEFDESKVANVLKKLKGVKPLRIPSFEQDGESSRLDISASLLDHVECTTLAPKDAIQRFCMEQKITLFNYLLTAFALSMRTITNEKYFAIVTPTANRNVSYLNTVGFFVNTIIVPINTDHHTVHELLEAIQMTTLEALDNQDVPFEYIIQKLNPTRDPEGGQVYPTSFVLESASPLELSDLNGIKIEFEESWSKETKYDQSWVFTEHKTKILLEVEYEKGKYHNSAMKRFVQLFTRACELVLCETSVMKILKVLKTFFDESDDIPHPDCKFLEDKLDTVDDIEKGLLQLWSQALPPQKISRHDNFFALGGHSLLVAKLSRQITKKFNFECPARILFKYQTIDEVANYIRGQRSARSSAEANSKTKVRTFQVRVCELQESLLSKYRYEPTSALLRAYDTGFSINVEHPSIKKMNTAFSRILMRHSALRTRFCVFEDGKTFCQQILSGTECFVSLRQHLRDSSLSIPNPFQKVPLLAYLSATSNGYCFHVRLSHLICDERSLQIIAKDLQKLYYEDGFIPKQGRTYVDFTEDYHAFLQKQSKDSDAFWSRILSTAEGVHAIGDKPLPQEETSDSAYVKRRFGGLNLLVCKIANERRCSAFSVLMTAFAKVIASRLPFDATNVILYCPIDMRQPSEDDDCVGFCLKTLPVILKISNDDTEKALTDVSDALAKIQEYSTISEARINELAGNQRWQLSNIMIVQENYGTDVDEETVTYDLGFTKTDLTFFVSQDGGDVVAKLEYRKCLFYQESIEEIIVYWARTIRQMVKDANNPKISSTNSFTPFASTNFLPAISFPQLLWNAFAQAQEKSFSFKNDAVFYTYATLRDKVMRVARKLQQLTLSQTGNLPRADTLVPIISTKCLDTWILCLAVLFVGAAYLPIDETDPIQRIKDKLSEIQVPFYISRVDQRLEDKVAIISGDILDVSNDNRDTNSFHMKTTQYDLAYTICTSGTTGKPKKVMISQAGLMNVAMESTKHFFMKPTDCVYQFTNFIFDNSVLELTMALSNSCSLYIKEDFFTSVQFFKEVDEMGVTHALLFPGLVDTFEDHELAKLNKLRYWIVGAESAHQRILDIALSNGTNVMQNYGPTETTAYALCKRMKLLDRPDNIGKPIVNMQVSLKRNGKEVPRSGFGELWIMGIGIMRGYFGDVRTDVTRAYNSGDIAKMLPNGDILYCGRMDEQVKIRGFRVEIKEIEAALNQITSVSLSKVLFKKAEQQLLAFIVPYDRKVDLDRDDLRNKLMELLPYYAVPTRYYKIDALPLTKNAKVDRIALEMIAEKMDTYCKLDDGFENEPEDPIENQLIKIFRAVLPSGFITTSDDFFKLGGNSLLAIKLAAGIAEKVDPSFVADDIFRYRNVKRIAAMISRKKTTVTHPIQPDDRKEKEMLDTHLDADKNNLEDVSGANLDKTQISEARKPSASNMFQAPLSFQQQQMLFLNETADKEFYDLIFVQIFTKDVAYERLRWAFLRLIMRQPSLRTIFPIVNYETRQEILSGTEAYFQEDIGHSDGEPEEVINSEVKVFRNLKLDLRKQPSIMCSTKQLKTDLIVVLQINHIISDAWSTRVMEAELSELYKQAVKGYFLENRLAYTYVDYSFYQQNTCKELRKLAKKYAEKLVSSEIFEDVDGSVVPVGDSPTYENNGDLRRQSDRRHQQAYHKSEAAFESSRIQKLCKLFDTTPFVIFIALFNLSFHEIKDGTSLVTVPIANRSTKTYEIIGNFLNYLLIPLNSSNSYDVSRLIGFSAKPTSREDLSKYITHLAESIDAVRQYKRVPYLMLIDAIRKELKDKTINNVTKQLNQIFFNFRYDLENGSENHLPSKSYIVSPQKTVYPLEIDVDASADGKYICKVRSDRYFNNKPLPEIIVQKMAQYLIPMEQLVVVEASAEYIDFSHVPDTSLLPPANESIEFKLKSIWRRCLKLDCIHDSANFFLVGGNSILSLKLKQMITEELKINIDIEQIFEYSTFNSMVNLLKSKSQSAASNGSTAINLTERYVGQVSQNPTDNQLKKVIVFFHPLVAGVVLPYSSLLKRFIKNKMFLLVGVENPNSFSSKDENPRLKRSVEDLCSIYVKDLKKYLENKSIRVFIGASLGGLLAYECARQLLNEGVRIDELISIDGTADTSHIPTISYEQHLKQIENIMMRRSGATEIDTQMRQAMVDNAWELLNMARRYVPPEKILQPLHMTLIKAVNNPEKPRMDDYGWSNLCAASVLTIPFTHDDMLDEQNADYLYAMIAEILNKIG